MVRPRTFDEDKVIDRAIAVFGARGYRGASIPVLSRELGICRQSLYATFGDKRGLYLRALEVWGRREVDAKLERLRAEGSPLENVRTVVRGLAALATNPAGASWLMFTAMMESPHDAEIQAAVNDQVERQERGLTDALARAQELGEVAGTVDARLLARALTTAFHGVGLMTRLPGSEGRIADTVSLLLRMLENAADAGPAPASEPTRAPRRFEPGI